MAGNSQCPWVESELKFKVNIKERPAVHQGTLEWKGPVVNVARPAGARGQVFVRWMIRQYLGVNASWWKAY